MSNWYKTATLGNDITFVITTWLRNALNHPQIANTNDDISHQMQGVDNVEQLSGAINMASQTVMREQGYLTSDQQELIQNLYARISDPQIGNDPMAVQPINNEMPKNDQVEMQPLSV